MERRFIVAGDTLSVDLDAVPMIIVKPVYPEEAKRRYMEGTVWLRLWVTTQGTVRRARVEESTDVIFNESALQAGMSCTFTPAKVGISPVEVSVYIPYNYKLSDTQ
ncbi:MAG: energy transducer TonB [Bacteroidota bacterium]